MVVGQKSLDGRERSSMENREDLTPAGEPAQLQAEFPANGTPLNPVEESWVFSNSAAVPADDLAKAMQQGE
jgi:hypothetical protein